MQLVGRECATMVAVAPVLSRFMLARVRVCICRVVWWQ